MLYDPNDFCKDPLQIDFGDLRTEASSNFELWRLDSVLSCEEITKESLCDLVLTHCEECLYIIGNGFDLHHGLKTRYLDFRVFLKQDKTNIVIFSSSYPVILSSLKMTEKKSGIFLRKISSMPTVCLLSKA